MSRQPNWTPAEDALLGSTLSTDQIVERTGRKPNAVWNRRAALRNAGKLPPAPDHMTRAFARRPRGAFSEWSKPAPAAEEEPELRPCLRCRLDFRTTRFVRVCAPCKKTEDWS